MFRKDKWPFTPICLSEIVDHDTLSVIESGCCERLRRPLTILDCDPQVDGLCHRIESINEKQRYERFCRYFRDEMHVRGGEATCQKWDIEQAQKMLSDFQRTGEPFRALHCHMELVDMTYVVQLKNRPVALVFSGQYRPAEGINAIHEKVRELGIGSRSHITLDDEEREQLLTLAQQLPPMPADARERLEQEVKHIQRIAEAEFEQLRRQWEQDFLDELRRTMAGPVETGGQHLRQVLDHALELVMTFCRCEYAVFYGNVQEGETILAPISKAGVPSSLAQGLPHFNWKKAGLSFENLDARRWDIAQWNSSAKNKGFRGENIRYFAEAGCIIPTTLSNRYHGVLVLGPFAEQVKLHEERRFLIEIADAIGWFVLTNLEVMYLERERRRWRDTAALLLHQLRTALTPIAMEVGWAKALIRKGGQDARRVEGFLSKAEDMALQLAQSAKQTLAGHVLQLEHDDLDFEEYPLSVLVENCAAGFVGEAEKRKRSLVIEDKVENLPRAEVDVARLTIALANLIDNALKYSFPDSVIYVRAQLDWITNPNRPMAIIEVDNLGYEISPQDRERIFEQGTRGLTAVKLGRIPGSGLGLWEVRAVVEAHGGEISASCSPTAKQSRWGRAYHVVFSIKIPLKQK